MSENLGEQQKLSLPSALSSRDVTLSTKGTNELRIHCLSDIHVAGDRCDLKWIKRRLKEILDAGPDHRIIAHGDWADIRNKGGKSFSHGAMTPQQELDDLIGMLKPVAPQIDLIIPGNHEHRIMREVGLDFMAQLAARLERPEAYRPGPTIIRYGFGPDMRPDRKPCFNYRFSGLVHHGFGGGSNGAALNRIKQLGRSWYPEADFVVMGHVHYQTAARQATYMGFPPILRQQLLVISGTAVDHEPYAQAAGFEPSAVGAPCIIARGKRDSADRRFVEMTASV